MFTNEEQQERGRKAAAEIVQLVLANAPVPIIEPVGSADWALDVAQVAMGMLMVNVAETHRHVGASFQGVGVALGHVIGQCDPDHAAQLVHWLNSGLEEGAADAQRSQAPMGRA